MPKFYSFAILILFILISSACALQPRVPTPNATLIFHNALLTAQAAAYTPTPLPSATQPPTHTVLPLTPTPVRTPPVLPGIFLSDQLNKLDVPSAYLKDTCQYLLNRWNPNNAAPGTVVMPIMFHSITKGEVKQADQISVGNFNLLMRSLKEQSFEAITVQQLADFLDHNAKIPARSTVLIVDDRKSAVYFQDQFFKYYQDYHWIVTNAWISFPDTLASLWDENAAMEKAGWVDHQAHGVIHNIPISAASSDAYIQSELQGSISAIEQHFGKKPIAYIWPGGGFTPKAAQVAQRLGYQLGFTINPRGPLMFNWIPLSGQPDPARPSFLPEGAVADPLMVLPRYWDTDAIVHIDTVRQIGKAAAILAEADKATELEYYDIMCKPILGDIPKP